MEGALCWAASPYLFGSRPSHKRPPQSVEHWIALGVAVEEKAEAL